ncbi:MAG TPA: DUF4129 domain-containing protein, partial [Candidatus Dormibacteraeota bacterium]|nr:DUF4129 domain-containing protein [Candidatus Dormibacteraeota bacterium]
AAALATLPSPLPPALWPAAVALRAGDRPAAATDLRALLAELAARPGPARGLAGVTAALAATYADPALARARAAAPPPNWLLTVLRWLYSLLRRLFHALPGSAWILIGAIVVVLGAATAVWRLRRTVGGPEARASSSSSPLPSAPDPAELWRAAEAAAARGASREAVRLAFAALLATAAGHRALAVDPAWTNAELLRAAERSGRLGAALRPVVGTFDATVYGGQDPGPEGCLEFLRRCRALARTLA